MSKKYKQQSPENTINTIRNILHNKGVFLKETSFKNDGMNSCRLSIISHSLESLDIGTNGKGMSYLYALASGYAEFLERLQNDMLLTHSVFRFLYERSRLKSNQASNFDVFINKNGLYPEFVHSCDEKWVPLEEVITVYGQTIRQMLSIPDEEDLNQTLQAILGKKQVVMVPFYSTKEQKEILFPIDLALISDGSNGMCAGNTPQEAILQGLCEIFERYAIKRLFFERLTPPTIPDSYFQGTEIFHRMQILKKSRGYDFVIKDCSLGLGLPVIGLLTVDKRRNAYNFKLGADFVYTTALERCFTELYQSRVGSITVPFLYVDDTLSDDDTRKQHEEYMKIVKNGTGQWPKEIFSGVSSYHFSGFNSCYGTDDALDIRHSVDLVERLGSSVLIRDNSFLGFPTYNIVAPGISNIELRGVIGGHRAKLPIDYEKLFSAEGYSIDDFLENMSSWVVESMRLGAFGSFNDIFPFYNSKELADLDPNLFLSMAAYKREEFEKSHQYLCYFLKGKNTEYSYYYACLDYIKLKHLENKSAEYVELYLTQKYDQAIAHDVSSDMANPSSIFQFYSFSRHLNGGNLLENKDSKLVDVLKLMSTINAEKSKKSISQDSLRTIFNQ